MSLKLPDVPNLPNPGLYQLLLALRQQMVDLSSQFDDLAAQAGVLAPQFSNDTSIATTAWVNRVGKQYASRVLVSANKALDVTAAGALVLVQAAVTVTLPLANTFKDSATITLVCQAGPATVQCAGTNTMNPESGAQVTSVAMLQGDTLELVTNGGGGVWLMTGGSVQLPNAARMSNWPLAPQFDNTGKLATTAFVQRALGNFYFGQWIGDAVFNPPIAQAGSYFLMAAAGATFNLPFATGAPAGAAFFVQAGAQGCVINPAAGYSLYHPINGLLSTYVMGAGKSVLLVFDSGASWLMSGTGL